MRQQYESTAAQLAVSEERLRLAIDASKMGIRDWNILTGKVVLSAEHERLFGLKAGSFEGTWEAFLACIHRDDRDRVARAVADCLENKTDYQNEYRVIWPNNSERWIASRGKFYYSASGQAIRSMAVVWDITDRKQLEFDRSQALARERSYLDRLQKLTAASVEINSTLSVEEILQLAVERAVPSSKPTKPPLTSTLQATGNGQPPKFRCPKNTLGGRITANRQTVRAFTAKFARRSK
ncbi:MAG: PAS domain-containing protein [Microcoleus sp. SU_5_6]|nr:PAS domain-containing protein [Microcoleus sp. SU_5_6]